MNSTFETPCWPSRMSCTLAPSSAASSVRSFASNASACSSHIAPQPPSHVSTPSAPCQRRRRGGDVALAGTPFRRAAHRRDMDGAHSKSLGSWVEILFLNRISCSTALPDWRASLPIAISPATTSGWILRLLVHTTKGCDEAASSTIPSG